MISAQYLLHLDLYSTLTDTAGSSAKFAAKILQRATVDREMSLLWEEITRIFSQDTGEFKWLKSFLWQAFS